jgi:hypothetical protein
VPGRRGNWIRERGTIFRRRPDWLGVGRKLRTVYPTDKLSFSETEIQSLFGHEAAEDEDPVRLREYYFKSSIYEQVVTDLPLRILVGHKGVGKSALFQIAVGEDSAANRLNLTIKPDDVLDLGDDTGDFLQTIRNWKRGLLELLASRAVSTLGGRVGDSSGGLLAQYGGQLLEFLRVSLKDPDKLTIAFSRRVRSTFTSTILIEAGRGGRMTSRGFQRYSTLSETLLTRTEEFASA